MSGKFNLDQGPIKCACDVSKARDVDSAVRRLLNCWKCRGEILANHGQGAMSLRDLARKYGGDTVSAAVNRARSGR